MFDKLPEFKGPNPTVWLSKAEKFFHTYGDNEKLTLVYFYLEGDAMKWFIRERRIMKFTDWSDFKCRLLAHFVHVPAYSSVEVHYKAESTSSNNSVSETELVKKKITSPNVEEVHEAEVHQQDLGCEIVLETVMVKQNDSGDFVAGVQQKELNHEAVQETNMLLPKESLAATDQELDLHCETGHVPSYLAGEAYQHVDSMNTDAVLKENLVDKNAERNQKWIEYSKPAIVKEDGVHDIDEGAKRSLMVIEQFQCVHQIFSQSDVSKRITCTMKKDKYPKSWRYKFKSRNVTRLILGRWVHLKLFSEEDVAMAMQWFPGNRRRVVRGMIRFIISDLKFHMWPKWKSKSENFLNTSEHMTFYVIYYQIVHERKHVNSTLRLALQTSPATQRKALLSQILSDLRRYFTASTKCQTLFLHLGDPIEWWSCCNGKTFYMFSVEWKLIWRLQGCVRRFTKKEYSSIWHRWRYKTLECISVVRMEWSYLAAVVFTISATRIFS